MSKYTRRKFVGVATAAAGAVVGLTSTGAAQRFVSEAPISTDALSMLGWDSFLPLVGTEFSFGVGRDAVPLKLVDMKDSRPLRERSRKLRQENFVLRFTGPSFMPLEDGTYAVEHFRLGTFQLFITTGDTVDGETSYLAVFNRVTTR